MKKLLLAALAIAAMAACTKSNVQLEQPGEISFQPVTQKATKAVVDGPAYPKGEAYNFNIWAWWGNHDAETSLAYFFTDIKPYIAHGTFENRENSNNWGGVTPYYWPSNGSLVFAGYSPADADGNFSYDWNTKTLTVTDYTQPNTLADAKDLMWFDVTDKSYDQNVSATQGIPVTFQHALSWLTFKFNLKDAGTPAMWTITNVELTGIEDKATFTATKDGNTSWSLPVVSEDGKDNINVFTTDNNYTVIYNANGTVLPGTDVEVKDSNGNVITGVKNNAVLVIPQSCAPGNPNVNPAVPADAEIKITYNLKTYVGNTTINGQTITLPLNGTQITDDEWLPGKHYIYTITFGANEILIAPSVENWGNMPVENIPIQ